MSKSPPVGHPTRCTDGLVSVLAPNASPMTYWGTNTYILGEDRLCIIDPGPNDPEHLKALLSAINNRPVTHICVTHSHLDHSPLARPLAEATGAPILAFGDSNAGRSPVMQDLATSGLMGGGEGVDTTFCPDIYINDGQYLSLIHI